MGDLPGSLPGTFRWFHEKTCPTAAATAELGARLMLYLLDTNIVVFMIRGLKVYANPNERQRERHKVARRIFQQAHKFKVAGDTVALSAITVAELEFGAWDSD